MYDEHDDLPVKHKKKSKVDNAPRADHKHIYELCLLKETRNNRDHTEIAEYCTICGKVKDMTFCLSWDREKLLSRYGMTKDDILTLKTFEANGKSVFHTKYVKLE